MLLCKLLPRRTQTRMQGHCVDIVRGYGFARCASTSSNLSTASRSAREPTTKKTFGKPDTICAARTTYDADIAKHYSLHAGVIIERIPRLLLRMMYYIDLLIIHLLMSYCLCSATTLGTRMGRILRDSQF